jgi:hypothetical protein
MKVDTAGRVTMPYQPVFSAKFGTAADTTFTSGTKMPFNTLRFDRGSNFNTTNNRFTAPVAGTYYFNASVYGTASGGASTMALRIYKNGADADALAADVNFGTGGGQISIANITAQHVLQLNAGDYIEIFCTAYNGSTFRIYTGQSAFFGCLLG